MTAYTNVWDDSFPPDTQQANLLGQDIRSTKLDIMQRVASFGAGNLSERPTPETTSATANWAGVMYWALDTKQAFRWNGNSWDNVTLFVPSGAGQTIFQGGGQNALAANTSDQPIFTGTIPADAFGEFGGYVIEFNVVNGLSLGNTATISLTLGATKKPIFVLNPALGQTYFKLTLMNNVSQAAQLLEILTNFTVTPYLEINQLSWNEDTTTDLDLKISAELTNAADTLSLDNGFCYQI